MDEELARLLDLELQLESECRREHVIARAQVR
jgi:hypothetical protein